MSSITSLIRSEIAAMNAYHVADVPQGVAKLDAMESPYHPFADDALRTAWLKEVAEAPLNLYPNPATSGLQTALKEAFAIPEAAQIVLGNGSDELIQLLTMLVAKPDAVMLALEPSFVMYRHNAALFGMNYVGVPLKPDFSLDLQAVLAAIAQHQPALIFLAYPNNPTGCLCRREDVEAVIEAASGVVVIDEAYGAFSGDTFLNQAGSRSNLVVMRTLSKIGFAGIRLGYAAMHQDLAAELAKIVPPYNMNQLTLTTAKFALRHIDAVDAVIGRLKMERERMQQALHALPSVQPFPSDANFITVRVPDADTAYTALKNANILVKKLHGSHALLNHCLRLTIGSPEQNDAVLDVLTSLYGT